jgi:Arc/MetJ-type ribon-helix-helix transcriptional regulator
VAAIERVTVTLPAELVQRIDRVEKNRSHFITEAVRRELDRRRREELRRSLRSPHPESADLAEMGIQEWAHSLPQEDAAGLVDASAGRAVRWVPGKGWIEDGR